MSTSLAGWVKRLSTACAAALIVGSCGDEVGHSPGDSNESEEPGGEGNIDFPECHGTDGSLEVGLIGGDAFYETPSFALRGDTVVVHRRGTVSTNAPEDLELVAVAPTTGDVVQLTAN